MSTDLEPSHRFHQLFSSLIADGATANATAFDLGRVCLNPTVDRGVINGYAAFAHHLLDITMADAIAAVPPHRPKDDLAFKLTPLEL
jgi:hypothetical protein